MATFADTCHKIRYISEYNKKTVFVAADGLLQYTLCIVATERLE